MEIMQLNDLQHIIVSSATFQSGDSAAPVRLVARSEMCVKALKALNWEGTVPA